MKVVFSHKKCLLIVTIIVMLTSIMSTPYAQETVNANGVVYENGVLRAVTQKSMLGASLKLHEIDVADGKLNISGVLDAKGKKADIATSGKIYASVNNYIKNNAVTIALEKYNNYEFLSCIIEKSAMDELLLPVNKHLKNSYVLKLAIKDTNTNDIIYFEDYMPGKFNFEALASMTNKVSKENEEAIGCLETWFLPYLPKTEGIKEDDSKTASELVNCLGQMSNTVSINATSPVTGISASAFMTTGSYYFIDSTAYGYYRISNEWPLGSGNILTQLLKWNWITQAPVPGGSAGAATLAIEVENQYLYNKTNDTINLWDTNSYLQIKNSPEVQFALLHNNADIITRVQKSATCNQSNLTINWKTWVGLLPYGKDFLNIYNLLTSVSYTTESTTSNDVYFYDRISDSLSAWGNVHRDYKFNIPSDKYLAKEGDQVGINVTIKKPTDCASYYTYYTGSKIASCYFNFSIYSRDGWGFYNVFEYTVTKEIQRTY